MTSPDGADRTDAGSTAEVAAFMLRCWDTTTDRTEAAAVTRAKLLMIADWAPIHDIGRRQISLYLEQHHGQWEVVGISPATWVRANN